MITVRLSEEIFTYDIHSLVKAFYQDEDVHMILTAETGENFSGFEVCYSESYLEVKVIAGGNVKKSLKSVTEGLERPQLKNLLKQQLYLLLSEETGKKLPWGTLTGIRPTKLPMGMLKEGKSEGEINAYMKDTYFTTDEKTLLSIEIAKRERAILRSLHGTDGFSLYIGIPFCPTTCLYCSFTSYPIGKWKNRVEEYLAALKREIDLTAQIYRGRILDTVYIGGGTPTTLTCGQLAELIAYIKAHFDFKTVQEFTVEAGRPDSITPEKLDTLFQCGVNRISINPQTMNGQTLKIIGRQHTVEQVREAFLLAREAGFTNINMDLILGLPGEDLEMVTNTLSEIKGLGPDSITVHSMAIKRAAGMAQFLSEHGEIKSINTPQMMEAAEKAAERMGMKPYYLYRQKNMAGNFENVGYAHEGKYGIYNILIMEEIQSIAALGAGSISKVVLPDGRIERSDNVKDVTLFIEENEKLLNKKKLFYDTIKDR
ncbi:MAG: coproporphyrinogen dehydrogenase HemZ [Lachnospiraceae bacterium]